MGVTLNSMNISCLYCDKPVHSTGLCSTHYSRWWRTGNPANNQQGKRPVVPIEKRLAANSVENDSGCLIWTLGISKYGYGKVKWNGRTLGTHTVAWTLANGEIPEGYELDHLCHTLDRECVPGVGCPHRRCINVAHLELVTKPENTRRRDWRKQ